MIIIKEQRKRWMLIVLQVLQMLSVPADVRASPLRDHIPDGWIKAYASLLPWIKRISVFLVIMGAVKMMEGYGKKGTYGMTGGAVYMIAGGILYVVCV